MTDDDQIPADDSPPSDQLVPHVYFPDYVAMGDCDKCGHVRESPIHI